MRLLTVTIANKLILGNGRFFYIYFNRDIIVTIIDRFE